MGWLAPQAVRDHSKAKGATRSVLMTIATYCDDAGIAQCTPSIKTIAKGCGFSERCVKDSLAKLKEMGELTAQKEGQGFHTKVYYAISPCLIDQQRDKVSKSLQEGMGNSRTMMGQLPHHVDGNIGQMSHHDGANGSKHGAGVAHINNINKDLKEEEKREERAHAQDDQTFDDDYFDQPESEAQRFQREQKELRVAIKRVTGSFNDDRAQSIALELHRFSITAFHVIDIYGTAQQREEIGLEGDGYWYTDSQENRRGGMPFLGNIENISRELQNRERGITKKQKVPASTTTPAQNHLNAGYKRPDISF